MELSDKEIYDMLELEVGKPIVPKVSQKINNQSLLLIFKDQTIQVINTEFGYTDLEHPEFYANAADMRKQINTSPWDYPFDETNRALGKAIRTAYPDVVKVKTQHL
jgi:hypothetical protein